MRSSHHARRLPILSAAVLSLALGTSVARAGTEVLKLTPVLNETIYAGEHHEDTFSCFPFTCFFTSGVPAAPAQSPSGQFAVGFDYFFDNGTGPCNCREWAVYAHRGATFFKSEQLPHFFLTANLVLTPKTTNQHGNNRVNLVTGLFEVSHKTVVSFDDSTPALAADGDAFLFPAQLTTFDGVQGRLTLLREAVSLTPKDGMLKNPVFSPFPSNPGPATHPVSKNGLTYTIDVTQTVHDWVGDWIHRTQTPLRGFVVVGPDESLSHDKTTAFIVEYEATLEFVIEDPPL